MLNRTRNSTTNKHRHFINQEHRLSRFEINKMASIIPNQTSPSVDQDISMPQEGNLDCVGFLDLSQVKSVDSSCVESLLQAVHEKDSTVGPRSTIDISSAIKIKESEFEAQDPSQPVDDSVNEVTEASSTSASSPSNSSQVSIGQHHPHHSSSYTSYYPSYHSSYYYPPGAYYPPPPSHGGHQSYSHYYAHYPPPPGAYYPPPPYHYYAQPSNSNAPELSSGMNNSTSSTYVEKDSNLTSRSATNSKSAIKGPYSAFSTTKKKPTTSSKSLAPIPQTTKPISSKIQPNSDSTSKKRKQASEPNNGIFRMNANKKSKQLAAESKAVAAVIAAKQAKTKEMEKQELSHTVLGRRQRKNAQSRMRASKLKQRIAEIEQTDPSDRTEEEKMTLQLFEERRQRKNGRSRERAVERKKEYERIMTIPESDWTKEEKQFVQETIVAKFKKNEGDRLRRKKLKEELDSTASSISSDWESLKHIASSNMKSKQGSKRKTSTNATPEYVDSSDNYHVGNTFECKDHGEEPIHHTKDAPLTPVTQKEVYSLLESTPTNIFGSTLDPNNKADFFSLNFGLTSPTKCRDFSANMDTIDFDSLELPTDGVSILDPSMAMTLGDEVIYSPHLHRHNLNEQDHHHHPAGADYSIHQFNSIGLSPLNSPRRNRSDTIEDGQYFPSSEYDITDVKGSEAKKSGGSNAITVSFSDDSA